MALPTYDKSKRRQNFQQLPKGAYVLKIMNAKEVANKNSSGTHLEIAFDIAEGEFQGFYMDQFNRNTSEDKKYNRDAYYYLNVPDDNSQPYVWENYSTFFADLEDSNNGYVFDGNVNADGAIPALKGKLIGGKFHIEQTEYRGTVYNHTRLRFTCVADDVRKGKAGQLPNDKLVGQGGAKQPELGKPTDFMEIPEGSAEEVPW